MRRASIVLAVLTVTGSAHAGSGAVGIVVPPVEIDVGGTVPVDGATNGPSTDVLVGMHWASLAWKPTSFDIGAGYVGSLRVRGTGAAIARMSEPAEERGLLSLHGAYLSVGRRILEQGHVRAWLSMRGELLEGKLADSYELVPGGAVRLAVELFARDGKAGGGGNAFGVFVGAVAVGFYVEASHRAIPSEQGATGISTGLSVRLPFVLAVAG